MKILHVSPLYVPVLGGGEHYLKRISEGLVSRGHTVTVLTVNSPNPWDLWHGRGGDLPEGELINGVRVVRFRPDGGLLGKVLEKGVRLKGGWRSVNFLFSPEGGEMLLQNPRMVMAIPYILQFDADLVASLNWYWSPAYHTYLARRLKRFPLVGIPFFHTVQAWCERPIYKRMLESCDAVVVSTSHEGQFVRERCAARVEVVGVGIDPETFAKPKGGEVRARYGLGSFPVVGFVGRQDAKKGAFQLIEAMRSVWQWQKEVRLVFAGPRPPDKDIEALLAGLSEAERERIVHIGEFHEKEKASLFDAFDVFARPSTEESFGIAYLEAWLCRKPVIGARIGSTQCVIDEGVDGLLVEPDNADDLARALIELLSNSNSRESMGRSGHAKTIAQYTWDKVIDRIERLYLELTAVEAANSPSLARSKHKFPSIS